MISRVSRFGAAVLAVAAVVGLASCPVRASEQSLLGIRINSPAKAVLQKLGNPTRVIPGAPTSAPLASGGTTTSYMGGGGAGGVGPLPQMPMGGPPGAMGMRGMMMGRGPMMMGGGGNGQENDRGENMPGEFGPPQGFGVPMGVPNFGPPAGYMGGGMNPGMQPGVTGTGTDQTFQNKEVTYIYDKPNGLTYAFLLSPAVPGSNGGRVIQITVAGYKSTAVTGRGIALGSTYSQVLAKYGFPEQQAVEGDTVFLSYAQRAHVAFQLMHNKVVSIMVAYIQ